MREKDMARNPTPLEPHPLVLFSTYGSRTLAESISHATNVELGKVEDDPFPNGETHCRLMTEVRGRDVFVVCSTCRQWEHNEGGRKYTGVNDSLIDLLVFGDAIARASAWRITAVIPYFGYARQDRKAASRTPITAKLVATMLEAAGFDRILTMDLHSDQIQGFFSSSCNLDHLNAGCLFSEYFHSLELSNAVVLSPDTGNLKKADKYRQGLPSTVDVAVIDKRRKSGTEAEAKRLIGEVEGKTVIIMDDIIASGGTMRAAVDFAIDRGAEEFYLVATHGEFVGNAVKKLSHPKIKQIVVTDTIPLNGIEKELPIHVLKTGDLFGEAILRIHRKESISELLGIYG
jgi:ribose-phosphate pyrophosphokinase